MRYWKPTFAQLRQIRRTIEELVGRKASVKAIAKVPSDKPLVNKEVTHSFNRIIWGLGVDTDLESVYTLDDFRDVGVELNEYGRACVELQAHEVDLDSYYGEFITFVRVRVGPDGGRVGITDIKLF